MRILSTIFFLWQLTSCSPTKTVFVSCNDRDCPYCIGTGIRGECNACNASGHNRDLINQDGEPICSKCDGYGVLRCGHYTEVERKKSAGNFITTNNKSL